MAWGKCLARSSHRVRGCEGRCFSGQLCFSPLLVTHQQPRHNLPLTSRAPGLNEHLTLFGIEAAQSKGNMTKAVARNATLSGDYTIYLLKIPKPARPTPLKGKPLQPALGPKEESNSSPAPGARPLVAPKGSAATPAPAC